MFAHLHRHFSNQSDNLIEINGKFTERQKIVNDSFGIVMFFLNVFVVIYALIDECIFRRCILCMCTRAINNWIFCFKYIQHQFYILWIKCVKYRRHMHNVSKVSDSSTLFVKLAYTSEFGLKFAIESLSAWIY